MKSLKTISILLLTSISSMVLGQTTENTNIEKAYIEVTGTAEKEVSPDEIYISITIKEREQGREKITIEKQEEELKKAIINIGIPLENLSLSDANADYIRVKLIKKEVISQSEYLLKVKDAKTVALVFKELDNLKILEAYISKVSHSEIENLNKEVKVMAIKSAKEKADYLLNAIEEETGKPLIIRENSFSNLSALTANTRGPRNQSTPLYVDGKKSKQHIQFKKIKLSSSIYVKFSIK